VLRWTGTFFHRGLSRTAFLHWLILIGGTISIFVGDQIFLIRFIVIVIAVFAIFAK
jgi:hypothetical protein